jgi:hypothetical protein
MFSELADAFTAIAIDTRRQAFCAEMPQRRAACACRLMDISASRHEPPRRLAFTPATIFSWQITPDSRLFLRRQTPQSRTRRRRH